MSETRLYRLTPKDGSATRLVMATSQAVATNYVNRDQWAIDVPRGAEVAELVAAGVKVEQASPAAEPDDSQPPLTEKD